MEKVKSWILSFLILAAVVLVTYSVSHRNSDKQIAKTEFVKTASASLEIKEALKLDNAEYKTAVGSKGENFSPEYFSIGGFIAAIVGLVVLLFRRTLLGALNMLRLNCKYNWSLSFIKMGMAMVGPAPFLKFNKAGLDGDNLKFVEDLEKRITGLGSDEEIKKYFKEDLALAVREATKQFKMFEQLDEANVTKLKEMLGEDDKGVRSILLKQGEAITKLQQNIEQEEQKLTIRGQVKEWHTRNKELIAKVKGGEDKVSLPVLEIRAANSPMTPANTISDTITINAGAAIRQGAEVFDLRRAQPTLWDYINKGRTGLETYPWVNKKVPADSGAADFIGPGVAKPGVSFTLEVEKSNAKKVAVSLKTATELLDDIDGMTTFIQNELAYQLKLETNTDLMTQTESSTKVAGLQTFSLPFSTSGLSTQNPNNWDVCRAIIAQIRLAFISSPVVIFMNPVDVANMDMDKSVSQGTYSNISGRPIPGGVIVEDVNMPAGYVQAVALDLWKNLIYKDFAVKFGWENDDFTKNLVTAIGEMRIHSFHSENDAAGFVFDAINDVKTAIAAI